jgi:hypothetical protein
MADPSHSEDGGDTFLRNVGLLFIANFVPSSLILSNLKMETPRFSETSVIERPTRRHIRQDGILHSHDRGNLQSYTFTYSS